MDFIRELRKRAGCTQRQMAARCGLSAQRISEYEVGRTVPTRRTLERIATAFGVQDELLGQADLLPPKLRMRLRERQTCIPKVEGFSWQTARENSPDFFRKLNLRNQPPKRFLRSVLCDSVLEAAAWSVLCHDGFRPCYASPLRKGFRSRPLRVNVGGEYLGTQAIPCLYASYAGAEWLVWIQPAIEAGRRVYRLDALVLVFIHGRRHWIAAEIDGPGHYSGGDDVRTAALGLPVVRFSAAEVLRPEFPSLFRERISQACEPPVRMQAS